MPVGYPAGSVVLNTTSQNKTETRHVMWQKEVKVIYLFIYFKKGTKEADWGLMKTSVTHRSVDFLSA